VALSGRLRGVLGEKRGPWKLLGGVHGARLATELLRAPGEEDDSGSAGLGRLVGWGGFSWARSHGVPFPFISSVLFFCLLFCPGKNTKTFYKILKTFM